MKKLLVAFGVLLIMSGCDNGVETLSCSNTSTANGVTTKTSYDIDYKDDDVKHIKITYDYRQDDNAGTTNGNNNATTNGNMQSDNDKQDGMQSDTDGLTERDNTNNNGNVDSNDVVDGVVGDAIDGTVNGVKDTILDLAGIKNTYENQMSTYKDINGFSYNVDTDEDNHYKVIYEIDMDKISDNDLARFNVTRDFSDIRKNYEDLGYTCK